MTDEQKEKRAILKGGIYAICLALLLLAVSVIIALFDKIFGL